MSDTTWVSWRIKLEQRQKHGFAFTLTASSPSALPYPLTNWLDTSMYTEPLTEPAKLGAPSMGPSTATNLLLFALATVVMKARAVIRWAIFGTARNGRITRAMA